MSKKRKITVIILAVLVAATLCFIWGNSILGKESSAKESTTVYENVAKPVFDVTVGKDKVTHDDFRKITHGAEFLVLGMLVCALFAAAKEAFGERDYLTLLPWGFYVAFIDETIQIFSGRGPAIKDVWIDFGGYFTAALLSFITFTVIKAVRKKKALSEEPADSEEE